MIDASAAWAAEHALLLFLLLPCLAALLALGAARAWLAVEARGRTVLGAGGAGLALLVFLALAVAVRRPGAVVAFDGALANALGRAMPDAFSGCCPGSRSWATATCWRCPACWQCCGCCGADTRGWPCSAPSRPDWAAR